jgi:hypothetical protein
VRAILHAPEDLLDLRREHVRVCHGQRISILATQHFSSLAAEPTLDAEELPELERRAAHLRQLVDEPGDVRLGEHQRRGAAAR